MTDEHASQTAPGPLGRVDEYGTAYFGDREFDGWVANLGHGVVRRGDNKIHLYDIQEMKDLAQILLSMAAFAEAREAKDAP